MKLAVCELPTSASRDRNVRVSTLEPGDSWLVPAGAEHSYRILEVFSAVEATAPPAQVHGRYQT